MSTLDLKSEYIQLAISPNDIEKTTFITRNGTFAFLKMPFDFSGLAPNFQKAIDIILKPVIGRFVMVYMDDAIITSPSFNEHIDHLNQLPNFTEQFNLFTEASRVGIGAVVNQNHRPILFTSRTLNGTERNYTVAERECLVVIWALNKFKTYFGSLPVKVFEHLSHRLDINHMKTVTYRPQANLTERVNRKLVQMIACFVEENHENWDRFLHEFAFALSTSVIETTNKTLAELFLG
ncbi:gag-pol fusion protein [Trichonephila clavipes]|nr:gag-pol fusion protein [Trichonephila clavipes]